MQFAALLLHGNRFEAGNDSKIAPVARDLYTSGPMVYKSLDQLLMINPGRVP
jgi:hypothetical protein